MRDPERRERIIRLIERIWMAPGNHDLRLYQLLGNASGVQTDPYGFEDDKLEVALQAYADRVDPGG